MDSTSVSVALKAGKNAGEISDLYEEAWAYLVATIRKNTKHKSSQTVLNDYLDDSINDGAGASTSTDLTFVFRSPSSMCNVQMAVTAHWFELAIALATPELAALCEHHGYAMQPRKADQADWPFLPHGDRLVGVTSDGQIVSDDGEQPLDEAELPKAVAALARKIAKSRVCQCAFCGALRAKKAAAPKWKPEKAKPVPKSGQLPPLEHFTSLAKAVKSPDRAGTCEVREQGITATVIPPDIGKLQRLTQLIINGYVTEIPAGLYTLANLDWLYLGGCDVTEDLAKLTKLKRLRLGGGKTYPEAIGSLPELESLVLRYNKTPRVPESITKLPKLTHLGLVKLEQLTTPLPPLGELASLRSLNVSEIRQPKGLWKRVDFSKLKELTQLALENVDLPEFPATLRDLPKLADLTLRSVGAGKVWPDHPGLPALEKIDAPFNELTAWPKFLNGLTALKHVNFAQCRQLASLDELRDLPALERLDLYGIAITALPAKAPKLPALKHLALSGAAELRKLPLWLAELPSLELLEVSSCWKLEAGEIDRLRAQNPKIEVRT